MKISIKIFIAGLIMLQFVGCDSESIYKDEHYKNLVYLLSKGNENVFIASYTLNEESPVQYVTVGCGGSNTNDKPVVVKIEPSPEMLDRYNKINYDYESQYAKLLPESKYEIPSYTVTIPARSDYHYQRMDVKVWPDGLSPDSVYFVPLKIVSVSEYEVNEQKQDVLFRVTIENDYATQYPQTYYRKSGQLSNPLVVMSGTKLVHPLAKDKVRMFIGNELYNDDTTPQDIARKSVVVQINADSTVVVSPYDSSMMEVEMLSNAPGYNRYNPSLVQGLTKQRVLWLNYRFRQKNVTTGEFGSWRDVEERLIRIEE
ncbi:BT_3987 domain-containing protein [Proteiniphilum sp.]|nr:DUF1735 domain-containing protein [Proteiniphilum sp.]MEA4916187.1 DUF1735 domain-containing protein [Proteiniphilum sp.]